LKTHLPSDPITLSMGILNPLAIHRPVYVSTAVYKAHSARPNLSCTHSFTKRHCNFLLSKDRSADVCFFASLFPLKILSASVPCGGCGVEMR
jgi:hypothetical protein